MQCQQKIDGRRCIRSAEKNSCFCKVHQYGENIGKMEFRAVYRYGMRGYQSDIGAKTFSKLIASKEKIK